MSTMDQNIEETMDTYFENFSSDTKKKIRDVIDSVQKTKRTVRSTIFMYAAKLLIEDELWIQKVEDLCKSIREYYPSKYFPKEIRYTLIYLQAITHEDFCNVWFGNECKFSLNSDNEYIEKIGQAFGIDVKDYINNFYYKWYISRNPVRFVLREGTSKNIDDILDTVTDCMYSSFDIDLPIKDKKTKRCFMIALKFHYWYNRNNKNINL
jgi:hypothetical protein